MCQKSKGNMHDMVDDNIKKLAKEFSCAIKDGMVRFEELKEELGHENICNAGKSAGSYGMARKRLRKSQCRGFRGRH